MKISTSITHQGSHSHIAADDRLLVKPSSEYGHTASLSLVTVNINQ